MPPLKGEVRGAKRRDGGVHPAETERAHAQTRDAEAGLSLSQRQRR